MMPEQEPPEHQRHPDPQPAFQPPYTSHDALFAAMRPREIIPFGGPRGTLALRAQFRETPLAGVLENLPQQAEEEIEEETAMPVEGVYAAHVRRRLENLLDLVEGSLGIDGSRAFVVRAASGKWDERERIADLPLLASAAQVRRTMARLVPELDTPEFVEVGLTFTPALYGSRQLILAEKKWRSFPEGVEEQPTNDLTIAEDQYTVFEQQENGVWQQRGSLAFFGCAEYEKTPYSYLTDDQLTELRSKTDIVVGRDENDLNIVYETDPTRWSDEQARVSTVLLDTPYPHTYFDEDADYDYAGIIPSKPIEVGRVIYASIPPNVSTTQSI